MNSRCFVTGVSLVGCDLHVADAYYGIYSVDVYTNEMTSLVVPDTISPKIGYANDLCISSHNKFIYFANTTSKYTLTSIVSFLLEGN